MKHMMMLAASLFFLLGAHAGQDVACIQDCYNQGRQGYDRNYCISMCESRPTRGGMMDQPGLPKNPAFEQMQPQHNNQQYQQRPLPAVADPKCMKDCDKRGYDYMLCRRQCSYSY
jgi:hypothetical protein